MSSFWNFAFGAILVIIWIIAGVFITRASILLTSFRDTDDNFHRAYWFTFWAAFTTWALIAIFIILVILSIVGVVALFGSGVGEAGLLAEGAEGESALSQFQGVDGQLVTQGISWLTIAFLIFALILVSITGVLAAIAAYSLAASPKFDRSNENQNTAYIDCIIAASMCLGAGGLLIIGIIIYFIVGYRRQQERNKELEQIRLLRRRALQRRLSQQAQQQNLITLQQQAALQRILQQTNTSSLPNITHVNPALTSASSLLTQQTELSPNKREELSRLIQQHSIGSTTSNPVPITHVSTTPNVNISVPIPQQLRRYLSS